MADLEPEVAPHLGFLRRQVTRALRRTGERWPGYSSLYRQATAGGNRNRAVGCMLAAEAVGGRWEDAEKVAVAIELGHKASLIRDDLADGDDYRYGRLTFPKRNGYSRAVAMADLLWSAALELVGEATESADPSTLRLFVHTYHEMALGQLADVTSCQSPYGSVASRIEVLDSKTGSLASLALYAGARAGGGSLAQAKALAAFARKLGTAFQLINDLNNVVGGESNGKRGIVTDAKNGTYTPLISYAIHHADGPTRTRLVDLLGRTDRLDDQEAGELRAILLTLGADTFTFSTAGELIAQGRTFLTALPPSQARQILSALTVDHDRWSRGAQASSVKAVIRLSSM
jgi:geranylgeranyl pyrophosphate synthase